VHFANEPERAGLYARTSRILGEAIARLDREAVHAAVTSDTNADALLTTLLRAEATGLFTPHDPLAAARLRGIRRRDELLAMEGGTVSGAELAARLHLSRQAVDKRRQAGRLLAIEIGRRGYLYPAWQVDETGVLPGLEAALAALSDAPPLAMVRFFLSNLDGLQGERPLDRLRQGDVESVVRAAARFGEHGAD